MRSKLTNLNDSLSPVAIPAAAAPFADETQRLHVLGRFSADALEDDPELQAIVSFAANLCDVPAAQVTLVEEQRQRFLVRHGLEERATPRNVSFCAHAMMQPELMEVRDATQDARFADNPFVTGAPGVRFYAGQPLVSDEGAPLGSICVIDVVPRPHGLTAFQREGLAVLAQAVMRRLNARRADLRAREIIAQREEQMRRMIEGVPHIAWSADAAGNFDYFNARWQETTGAPAPRVPHDWRPFIHPDDAEAVFANWEHCFAEGTPFEAEYRLRVADGSWLWVLSLAVPVAERSPDPARWFGTLTNIDDVRSALNERDLLARELSHRIKNIFAVVIGLAALKAGRAPEHQPFADELIAILRALDRAHDFVRPGADAAGESLQGLLDALFAPYRHASGEPRIRITGEDAQVAQRAATPLALVFHELATNSAKYGALSCEAGQIELKCEDSGDDLHLTWRETGGPHVQAPGDEGFGTRLIETSIAGQLQGSWSRAFDESGLIVRLSVPKEVLAVPKDALAVPKDALAP